MPDFAPHQYQLLAGVIALIAGVLIGYYVGSARPKRRIARQEGELVQARARIDELTDELSELARRFQTEPKQLAPLSEGPPRRQNTGSEIAGIIAALTALLSAAGGIYANDQSRAISGKTEEIRIKTEEITKQHGVAEDLRSRLAKTTQDLETTSRAADACSKKCSSRGPTQSVRSPTTANAKLIGVNPGAIAK